MDLKVMASYVRQEIIEISTKIISKSLSFIVTSIYRICLHFF